MPFVKAFAIVEGKCTEREGYHGLFDYSNESNKGLITIGGLA